MASLVSPGFVLRGKLYPFPIQDNPRVIQTVHRTNRHRDRLEHSHGVIRSDDPRSSLPGVVEVRDLNPPSYAIVQAFADRVSTTLDRLDALINNRRHRDLQYDFSLAGVAESTIAVYVFLYLLLLSKLRETSVRFKKEYYVRSFVHFMTRFRERAQNIHEELAVIRRSGRGRT
ncbi:hypothetical protein CLCR_09132 [Cladophialophora carrionii]|uniref:Uncharacterized protein n=1 Tax=Cladophialophora carrionii TaxID=86049 RepID=A0A1C1CSV6_9EURO|nr:hypothetical protein CLCR_09132 [Cladophialophora carrionii]